MSGGGGDGEGGEMGDGGGDGERRHVEVEEMRKGSRNVG